MHIRVDRSGENVLRMEKCLRISVYKRQKKWSTFLIFGQKSLKVAQNALSGHKGEKFSWYSHLDGFLAKSEESRPT